MKTTPTILRPGAALAVVLALFTATAPAFATAPLPETVVSAVTGDCDATAIRKGATQLPGDKVAFGLSFENRSFQALDQTADGNEASAACDVTVEVQVPHGYRLLIESFGLEGYVRVNGTNGATLNGNYNARHDAGQGESFANMGFGLDLRLGMDDQGDNRLTAASVLGAHQGPWSAQYDVSHESGMMASGCGETISLHSSLFLNANKADETGGPANVALFKDDQGGRVSWGWRLQTCDDQPFKGNWHSVYYVGNQPVSAQLTFFNESAGQYRTATWTGDLQIEGREENAVWGSWCAQGEHGWFRFDLNRDRISFRGSWGKEAATELGSWSGDR